MREVVFKNLTSIKSRKKDILLKEVFEKDGVVARTERRCFYFIKKIAQLDGGDDLQKLVSPQGSQSGKRQFHIMKEHNEKLGEDKLICKIIGTFYAIVNERVYTIAFLHSFKVTFLRIPLTH